MKTLEGTTVGILGGGQLGRMDILAGRRLGLRFCVYEPAPGATASRVADEAFAHGYEDTEALARFAAAVDVATLEFENVPRAAAELVAAQVPLRPNPHALSVCQHRSREKAFLAEHGFPCAPFEVVGDATALPEALARVGTPAVVKTAAFGYDGKGQVKVPDLEALDPDAIWAALGRPHGAVVERWIHHQGEVSVVCARGVDGKTACFPMAENVHVDHILHMSIVPARVPEAVREEGEALAVRLAEALDVVGLLAVELFVTDAGLLVNEMAPRPHNSGHYTLEGCAVSQFEQHMRAVVGLPLGDPSLLTPVVMVNLLGELWADGEPDFAGLLADPSVALHLYDKGAAKKGRKMGHFTVRDRELGAAVTRAEAAFLRLKG
ncbi:MAG: 5-(carboxyamino)imidazole ribonucleotide synthase [Deltaproteobacteria bacterium]|nr:5-(carboxyamino)imidazole ribonucleotide synthase [Deltaproteobacteria bacterium]